MIQENMKEIGEQASTVNGCYFMDYGLLRFQKFIKYRTYQGNVKEKRLALYKRFLKYIKPSLIIFWVRKQ